MSRTILFSRALSIMMRSGPLWVVTLAVTLLNVLLGRILPADGLVWTIITALRGALTWAFLTGALITIANAAAEGQYLSFAEGFRAGARPFLPLAAVGLILAVPTLIFGQVINLFLAPILTQFGQNTTPEEITKMFSSMSLLLCCIFPLLLLGLVLVSSITSALGIGAERAITLEAAGVGGAFKRGWELLTGKLSDMIVIALIMLGIGLGFGILFGCAAVVIGLASGIVTSNLAPSASNLSTSLVTTLIIALLTLPIQIYFSAVWTLAFRRWQGKDGAALAPA